MHFMGEPICPLLIMPAKQLGTIDSTSAAHRIHSSYPHESCIDVNCVHCSLTSLEAFLPTSGYSEANSRSRRQVEDSCTDTFSKSRDVTMFSPPSLNPAIRQRQPQPRSMPFKHAINSSPIPNPKITHTKSWYLMSKRRTHALPRQNAKTVRKNNNNAPVQT